MSNWIANPRINDSFFKVVVLSTILAGGAHIGMAFFFLYIGVIEMVILNIIATALFICLYIWLKKKANENLVLIIGTSEILLHAFFVAVFIGLDSGLHYFVLVIPPLFLLNRQWKKWFQFTFLSIVAIVFFGSYLYTYLNTPIYRIDSSTLELTKSMCAVATGFSLLLLFVKYAQLVTKNEQELSTTNKNLEFQTKKQQILLREIHHRVKNNLQIVSSLINLQKNQIDHKSPNDILQSSQDRINAIALVYQKIYQGSNLEGVNFKSYLKDIIESQKQFSGEVDSHVEGVDVELNLDLAVPLGLITSELITNSFKHAFKNQQYNRLNILIKEIEPNTYSLKVTDNGLGLPKDFNIDEQTSLGMEIIVVLCKQIGASVFHSNVSPGTEFEIVFKKNGSNTPSFS